MLLIEDAKQAAHELTIRVFPEFFGQRDQPDASLLEFVLAVDLRQQPPGKA
nr:hypothetical protein [uncultured Sphingomonas sp.]